MKLVRFSSGDGTERFGLYSDGEVTDLTSSYSGFADAVADIPALKARGDGGRVKVDRARLLPPVDRRSKVLCMAVNYYSHIKEMMTAATEAPILFPKYHNSLTGPYSRIPVTGISPVLDYEGEIAVVVGRKAHGVARGSAMDYIAGYTVLNDVSSRSLFHVKQGEGTMLDWFSGKNIDSSTPVGPWIVTADEAGDFNSLLVETFLNGGKVQSSSVSDMVFDLPRIIEFITSRITLDPGDVISTGTPAGVGVARKRTLQKGDLVRVEVKGVGALENPVG